MAVYSCNITGFQKGSLLTDKGELYYPIAVLDVPIELVRRYNISNYGGEDTPFPLSVSIIWDNLENDNIITNFFSDNYKFNFQHNSETGYEAINIFYYDNNQIIRSQSLLDPSNTYGYYISTAFKGSNNVYYFNVVTVTKSCYISNVSGETYNYEKGSSQQFGLWSCNYGFQTDNGFTVTQQGLDAGITLINSSSIEVPDPYLPGGTTSPGGGNGDFDNISDPVNFPTLPVISALNCKLITAFVPTESQLQDLADYMWSSSFDLDALKKIFANPIDCILGMSIIPCNPTSVTDSVVIGSIDTGITMNRATQQFVKVNCGSITINEHWGSYLDYDPYTKFEIYLPYIGIHALNADDIMRNILTVEYVIDILTGSCVANIKSGNHVLYSFIGQCSVSIPITGHDWSNVINGALQIASAIGTMVAVSTIPEATAAQALSKETRTAMSAISGSNQIGSGLVSSAKQHIEKSGSLSGAGGLMGIQTPYIIITRPQQAVAENQNKYKGYPSYITVILGEVHGFTVINSIILDSIPATEEELIELKSILQGGIVL